MTEFSRGELVLCVQDHHLFLLQVDHVTSLNVYAENGSVLHCNRAEDTLDAKSWDINSLTIFPREQVRKVPEKWMHVIYDSFNTV